MRVERRLNQFMTALQGPGDGDTPSAVAYMAATPQVEVKGVVVTSARASRSVNVTGSIPTGIFSGADTFTVDSQTKVVGNTNLSSGDVVAGGLIAGGGESASTIGSTPLQLLADYPPASSASSTAATAGQLKRAERRAMEMLRHEKAKMDRRNMHGRH